MKKIVHIGYQPMTSKFYADYYVGECIENGLEVEYWDISKIYFPKFNFDSLFVFSNVKHIMSFRELKALLNITEIETTIFFINITYYYKVYRLFILLSSFKCTLAFFGRGMFPINPSPKESMASKIWEASKSLDFKRIITGIESKITILLKKYHIVKPYDIVFKAGSEGYITIGSGYQYDLKTSKMIDVNYFDYDKYIQVLKGETPVENNYCLFLDEYLPYHPDVEILQIQTVNAKSYYYELNKFFDLIEITLNIRVIVAAHPKANKYEKFNPFEGRTIIFNKTCELVQNALFVTTHHSTAISFPILFKKPIIFLTSQAQKEGMPQLYELTLFWGKYLNCEVIHFDNFAFDKEIQFFVDAEKYEKYKYEYLTSKDSENKLSSDIFIEAISSL